MLNQVFTLVRKEFRTEWRQRSSVTGMLLYIVSTVMMGYYTFDDPEPQAWLALYWVILLFASVNATAKSFMQETESKLLYYYSIASPQAIIVSKMIYNICLLSAVALTGHGLYTLLLGNPLESTGLWFLLLLSASVGFGLSFTLVSSIASKARNSAALMAILSFPIILPQIIILVGASQQALANGGVAAAGRDLLVLSAINVITTVVSLVLFPYVWRE